MYLTRLADICRAAGLHVIEVRGWKTRGHGPMTAVKTVVCHHTAGPKKGNMPSLNVVTNGRPGLSGPLCNLALARDGTVYTVAAGLAYHAGQVRNSSYANAYAIGIEAEATGVDAWPAAQMTAYARLCAALVKAYGLTPARVLGHKEVCYPVGRKSDPNFSMPSFRKRVTQILNAPTGIQIGTPTQTFSAVWSQDRLTGAWMTPDNPTWAAQSVVLNGYRDRLAVLPALTAATSAFSSVATEVAVLKAGAGLTSDAAQQALVPATAFAADVAATRLAAARVDSGAATLAASVRTTLADAVRAAVESSTVRVHVTVHQNDPSAAAPAVAPTTTPA